MEEDEGRWLLPLLEQAQRHLAPRGHISAIVIDRDDLDGTEPGRWSALSVWEARHRRSTNI